jgi:hypothetical protein
MGILLSLLCYAAGFMSCGILVVMQHHPLSVSWLKTVRASASTTNIMENVTSTTDIIEPTIVDIIPRAPLILTFRDVH